MGGGVKEKEMEAIYGKKKNPKMALISEYLAADVSADALAIINIGYQNRNLQALNRNLPGRRLVF